MKSKNVNWNPQPLEKHTKTSSLRNGISVNKHQSPWVKNHDAVSSLLVVLLRCTQLQFLQAVHRIYLSQSHSALWKDALIKDMWKRNVIDLLNSDAIMCKLEY